jgi:hypothetical protein
VSSPDARRFTNRLSAATDLGSFPMRKTPQPSQDQDNDVARRRDETIKRMFATPPKKHKSEPKRKTASKAKSKKGG